MATLSDSLNNVVIRSTVGNVEKSRGSLTYTDIIKTKKETAIDIDNNISSRKGGKGKIIVNNIPIRDIANITSGDLRISH